MKHLMPMVWLCAGLATATGFGQDPAPYVAPPKPELPSVPEPPDPNLLKNSSFEYGVMEVGRPPDDWGFIVNSGGKVNGGITQIDAHTGGRSVGMGTPFLGSDKWQVFAMNQPVEKNTQYEYSVWVKAYPNDPLYGGAHGAIQIEWQDAAGREIARIVGDQWSQPNLAAAGGWAQMKVSAAAPAQARTASFVVTYHLNPNQKSGGSFLLDDARLVIIAK